VESALGITGVRHDVAVVQIDGRTVPASFSASGCRNCRQ